MRFMNHKNGIVCLFTALWIALSFSAQATTDPIVTKPIQGSLSLIHI